MGRDPKVGCAMKRLRTSEIGRYKPKACLEFFFHLQVRQVSLYHVLVQNGPGGVGQLPLPLPGTATLRNGNGLEERT